MDVTKMLAELREERAQIEEAILTLERLAKGQGKRRGRPPQDLVDQLTRYREAVEKEKSGVELVKIVATLHEAFRKAMFDPVFINEIAKYDQELDYLGPAEYGAWLREQYAKEKLVVERMGLSRSGS